MNSQYASSAKRTTPLSILDPYSTGIIRQQINPQQYSQKLIPQTQQQQYSQQTYPVQQLQRQGSSTRDIPITPSNTPAIQSSEYGMPFSRPGSSHAVLGLAENSRTLLMRPDLIISPKYERNSQRTTSFQNIPLNSQRNPIQKKLTNEISTNFFMPTGRGAGNVRTNINNFPRSQVPSQTNLTLEEQRSLLPHQAIQTLKNHPEDRNYENKQIFILHSQENQQQQQISLNQQQNLPNNIRLVSSQQPQQIQMLLRDQNQQQHEQIQMLLRDQNQQQQEQFQNGGQIPNRIQEAVIQQPQINHIQQEMWQHQQPMQQQNQIVVEKIRIIKDEKQVEELQDQIKVLLENIEQLHKAITIKEEETSKLQADLQEIDHLKRKNAIVDEENEALKMQLEEWQKRYNVLELSLGNQQNNSTFKLNGQTPNDVEGLSNSLKIKQTLQKEVQFDELLMQHTFRQEEIEALKTTIGRLELQTKSEKLLREEVMRLTDMIEARTEECEEWKARYMNYENTSNMKSGTNDKVQVNQCNPQMSSVFDPKQLDILIDRTQTKTNNIPEADQNNQKSDNQTMKRGRSPVQQYDTTALFKKRNNLMTSPKGGSLTAASSYIDDIKNTKNQQPQQQ